MEIRALPGTMLVSIALQSMLKLTFLSLTMGNVYAPFALSLARRFDFAYAIPAARVATRTWSPPSSVSKLFPILRLK